VIAALDEAVAFGHIRATDVVSILGAGHGVPRAHHSGEALIFELPAVPMRLLSDYAIGDQS
jgi:hypothetical protein